MRPSDRPSLIEDAPDLDTVAKDVADDIAARPGVDAVVVLVIGGGCYGASLSACKAMSPRMALEIAGRGLAALVQKVVAG
jgi:hypothetical protein